MKIKTQALRTTAALIGFALIQASFGPQAWAQLVPVAGAVSGPVGGGSAAAANAGAAFNATASVSPVTVRAINAIGTAISAPAFGVQTTASLPAAALPAPRLGSPALAGPPQPPAPASSLRQPPARGRRRGPSRPALQSLEHLLGRLKHELAGASDWKPISNENFQTGMARLGNPGQSLTIRNEALDTTVRLPTLVRVVRWDADHPVLNIPLLLEGRPGLAEMPADPDTAKWLRMAPARGVAARLGDLWLAISPHVSFQPGETVRVRDGSTGRIGRMTYVGLAREKNAGAKVELRDSEGRARLSPARWVYKDVDAGEPVTPELSIDHGLKIGAMMTPLEAQRGSVLESWLDGAAWLASHPEFLSAGHEERWRILGDYVAAVMRHDDSAVLSELLGLDFSNLLQLGVGVCRHLASLTAAILNEAGYDARLMIHRYGSEGHGWVEVHAPAGSGAEDWIIDPTNRVAMRASEAAKSDGRIGRLSSLWYAHPDRFEYPTSARPRR